MALFYQWHFDPEKEVVELALLDGNPSGEELANILGEGSLPWRPALTLVVAVLEAIGHASEDGYVLCAVNPKNIRVDPSGRISICGWETALEGTSEQGS